MKFHIITAMYNFSSWVEQNISMLKSQTYKDFTCVLVDDMSTDDTVECARKAIGDDPRFTIVVNTERKFKARNVYEAINLTNAADEDVIVMIDGDDRLANEGVLERLEKIYTEIQCWMTYGTYVDSEGNLKAKISRPYKKRIIKNNSYRKHRWLASHLKTFKFGLWKKIHPESFQISDTEYNAALKRALLKGKIRNWKYWKDIALKDLHDPSGQFIRRLDDKAFTFPMLEMAGEKAAYIDEILYIYNTDNARMSSTIYGKHQKKWPGRLVRDILCHKKPYKRLTQLD